MSSIFDSQINHYTTKLRNMVDTINAETVEKYAKGKGVDAETLKSEFIANTDNFKTLIYNYAKTLMPGKVSCTTYAAIVVVLAKKYGLSYKVMSGFCLIKSNPKYERDRADFETMRSKGVEHPLFANHVYVVINSQEYEFYNGETNNIDHIDVIEIQ